MQSAASISIGRLRQRGLAAWVALICVCLPLLTVNLGGYPAVWFDEGYKMNAARTLAEQGVYGTYTVDGYLPFDPGISSGPADVLPLAASFYLFGGGVTQARAIFVAYTLLAALALYGLAAIIFGRPAALLATLAVIAAPSIAGTGLLITGRQVLGEAPALALILSGVWLWARSWSRPGGAGPLGAGLLLGLGLLSKSQIGIALLPALLIIAVGRGWPRPGRIALELLPVALALGVVIGWSALGRALTDEATRRENAAMLLDAVRSNLITGLWGRTLSRAALALTAIMALAAGIGGWRLWRRRKARATDPASWWAEAFLTCFVCCYTLWFALLSVGWPRYAYAGLVVALLLLGGAAASTVAQERGRLAGLRGLAWLLVAGGLVGQLGVGILAREADGAARTAAYINTAIEPGAVIETWEWELDALSRHRAFHHPDQRYLFLAIRQFSHQQTPFDLPYDPLQADPDYLVLGSFSSWTRIYRPETLDAAFTLIAQIDNYQIYRRRR